MSCNRLGLGLWAVLLLLAGCGDLPRPFAGNPGATAMRLAQPPPARLAVSSSSGTLLTDDAAARFTAKVTEALTTLEVPAFVGGSRRGEWSLDIGAQTRGANVVPTYTVMNPAGQEQGKTEGPPVPAAAWAMADKAALDAAANQSARPISDLLTQIEAARRQTDPNSLLNRATRILLLPVTGAPGDGNISLTTQIRNQLGSLGLVVQDVGAGTDYTVTGNVSTVPMPHDQLRVEIVWTVTDAQGREAGKVAQLNEVPKATLSLFWGEVAAAVAREAAPGIRDVVFTNYGQRPTKDFTPKPDGAAPPAGGPRAPAK